MTRMSRTVAVSLLFLAVVGLATAGPVAAQAKPDLTIALSSFSTETLDPVLGGHIVKYYLSMMFDYLVGTTPDGQLSKDGGIALRWENSADHRVQHLGGEARERDGQLTRGLLGPARGRKRKGNDEGQHGPDPEPHVSLLGRRGIAHGVGPDAALKVSPNRSF